MKNYYGKVKKKQYKININKNIKQNGVLFYKEMEKVRFPV